MWLIITIFILYPVATISILITEFNYALILKYKLYFTIRSSLLSVRAGFPHHEPLLRALMCICPPMDTLLPQMVVIVENAPKNIPSSTNLLAV